MNKISEKLLNLIQKKDLSYNDLAKNTGIPKSALQRYATGVTEKIPIDRLELLAKALNVSSAYLMGWEEDDEEKKHSEIAAAHFRDDMDFSDLSSNMYVNPMPIWALSFNWETKLLR